MKWHPRDFPLYYTIGMYCKDKKHGKNQACKLNGSIWKVTD